MLNNPYISSVVSGIATKVPTMRDIKSGFRVTLKGGIPEPSFPAQTFSILGHTSMSFGALKEGYLDNARKYYFDTSNLSLSPETGKLEEMVESSEIMPAVGPNFTPRYLPSYVSTYKSYISKMAIRAANTYWRQLTIQQLQLFQNEAYFKKGVGSSAKSYAQFIASWTVPDSKAIGVGDKIDLIKQNGIDEADIPTDDISLIWASEVSPPNNYYGKGNQELVGISKGILIFLQLLDTEGLIDPKSEIWVAWNALADSKEDIISNFDLQEATQDIFGNDDLAAIERVEAQPFIPFDIYGPALAKGSPNILRIHLKGSPSGMESNRINFDLGEKIRMTIEQGTSVKILRRRNSSELDEFFRGLDKSDQEILLGEIVSSESKDRIRIMEERLEALYLSLLIYSPTGLSDDIGYNDALSQLQDQEAQINQLKKEIAQVRKDYKEKAKTLIGKTLTPELKAQRLEDIKDIKDKIAKIKQNVGKNEALRRKIAHYEKIIYAQIDTWQISNATVKDSPFEVTIVDYGVGMILFEANGQKDAFIFKDKETIKENLKADKKLTQNQSIKTLGPNSFTWLIGDIPLRISGNGGSFTFAQDTVRVGKASVEIPVSSNKPIDVQVGGDKDSGYSLTISQDADIVLITNLPAYSSKTKESNTGVKGSVKSDGGTITAELIPGGDPTEVRPQDVPGYTRWVEFLSGNAKDPYHVKDIDTQYYTYRVRITFEPNESQTSLPLLFRGFINIKAVARDWKELEGELHVLEPGDNINGKPYTINIEPTFNEQKRRVIYQVTLTYKESIPENINERIYDYLSGKRCDIDYLYQGNYYRIMTDGYIGDATNENMLTVTTPPDPNTSVINGFYHYGSTKTIFNVMDSARFIEDKLMSESLILEGYNFRAAIYTILVNSGFPEDKLTKVKSEEITGKYVSAKNPKDRFLPISLPGEKHSFVCDESSNRGQQILSILDRFGWDGQGLLNFWVDRDGLVRLDQSIIVNRDPRWGNLFFYVSRGQLERTNLHASTTEQQARYIYFGEITRRRSLEDFFSILKVRGAPDPITGKISTIGFSKKEVISDKYKNENIYLGHHKEAPPMDLPDAHSQEELVSFLYSKVNQYLGIKEIWSMKVPYNPFILPMDVIFVAPDNKSGSPKDFQGGVGLPRESLSSGTPSGTESIPNNAIAWKVINVSASVEEDTMVITMTPPNREERNFIKDLTAY